MATPSIALGTSEVTLARTDRRLRALRQRRPRRHPARHRAHHAPPTATCSTSAPAPVPARSSIRRYVGMMNAMLQRDADDRHRPARRRSPAGRPPARPAPARISATPGSSATPRVLTAGVWFGNDDGKPTKKASGSNLPAIAWQPLHDRGARRRAGRRSARQLPLPRSGELRRTPARRCTARTAGRSSSPPPDERWAIDARPRRRSRSPTPTAAGRISGYPAPPAGVGSGDGEQPPRRRGFFQRLFGG